MNSDHADERNFYFNPGRFSLLPHMSAIVVFPGSVMDINATSTRRSCGVSGRRGETNAFCKKKSNNRVVTREQAADLGVLEVEQSEARVMGRPSVKRGYSQCGM